MGKLYACPVCGWTGLDEKPKYPYSSHEICSCCGTQFGLDVVSDSGIKKVREEWLAEGANWFDDETVPTEWNVAAAIRQIKEYLGSE
ncbi:hypothetical protein QSV34_08730 [Porticoccus sp. W117]|uniref:hypothetical protein n=1 Tax=Porticoccus sp. W117 TaxID=3054777 RepID=UPI00259A389B|nr:hypothetical protein [Porticoccus sp. W117]MDM3871439.1 hypothetical protein [Porticoccus sp. W117]